MEIMLDVLLTLNMTQILKPKMWREKTLKHKDTETLRNKQKRINLDFGL